MQEAARGNKGTGTDERERGLNPILTDAEVSDEASMLGEEVLEVAAPTVVGALATGRVGEVAEAGLVHRLMHAVQFGAYRAPQLLSARWGPVEVRRGGFHDPALVILQRGDNEVLDRALIRGWHRARSQDLGNAWGVRLPGP
jgi:hypothetical protein